MKNIIESKKFVVTFSMLGLFMLSTGFSWAAFSFLAKDSVDGGNSLSGLAKDRSKISEAPKTEACPINGEMFSKAERDIWETRRPMAVVIENHLDSRPQSGLSRADVVYEVVAEGGITRFLAIFYCGASASDITIGPIRSARTYLINWASEYGENPLFVHFGGANNICGDCPGGVKPRGTVAPEVMALETLIKMGWRHSQGNALDGGANVSYPAIKRDQTRLGNVSAWEHSAIGSSDLLFDLGIERGFGYEQDGEPWHSSFVQWKFEDDAPVSGVKASEIEFEFWSNKPEYNVRWEYDASSNSYKRFNGGKAHTDWEFDKPQLSVKNVVIQFVFEKGPVDRELHMYYETVDEGDALIFKNGDVIEGSWEKDSASGRTIFYDKNGDEISFVRGKIWIEAVPRGNDIEYN